MEELFERYYDNPVDNDGNQKPNKWLGTYEIIEILESDFYNSIRIAKSADNKIYLVIEREVSGYNGGTHLRILEIKSVQHLTNSDYTKCGCGSTTDTDVYCQECLTKIAEQGN